MTKRIAIGTAAFLLLSVAAAANWAAWLGWDQHRDVLPDGSETGPYQVWQVAGLIVVLIALTVAAAALRHPVAAVAGPVLGTMVALCADWSDDSSGLWLVGACLAFAGLLAGAVTVTVVVHAAARNRSGGLPA
ncbi:hypothetical protein BJF79_33195 [Actinomadura sp. CNU-125]|uniref:hypothetical protein n=1 Tax=Actinomadura sp. CNU-125 TaxID=1904961 RepID=UPI0009604041|nr:hypothetical protein [Actinomadura sp. CNU-125]OLT34672.1 hypothetical protein BJF79_33195 [Actinomadura sp. CNU-125]